MNQSTNSIMRRHGGQPEVVKEQSAVAPTFLDRLFHQRQAQLKSNPPCGLRAESSRPLFCPEFAEIEPKDNDTRWLEYQRKLIARRAA